MTDGNTRLNPLSTALRRLLFHKDSGKFATRRCMNLLLLPKSKVVLFESEGYVIRHIGWEQFSSDPRLKTDYYLTCYLWCDKQ